MHYCNAKIEIERLTQWLPNCGRPELTSSATCLGVRIFCLFYETTSNLLSRAANHSKLGGQRLRPRSPFWLSEYETVPPEFGSGALPTADLTVPGRVTARHNQADRIYNSAGALFVKAPSAGFASNDIGAGFDASAFLRRPAE